MSVHDPGITLLELLVFTIAALIGVVAFGRWRSYRRIHRCTPPRTVDSDVPQ